MASRIKTVLEMIKFEHSVFALPFALTGALLAARATRHDWPSLRQIAWIIVAMVAARSAAMTMNRIADLRYDRENPRTQQRALPTGALTLQFAWLFTVGAVAVFFVAAWQLNRLALRLAPLAIAILFFYSFTKRFTNWSLHQLVASFSRICSGYLARRRMDRHHGRSRSAHAHSLRGRDGVGRRV